MDLEISNNSPDLLCSITVNNTYLKQSSFYLTVLKRDEARDTLRMATTITKFTM